MRFRRIYVYEAPTQLGFHIQDSHARYSLKSSKNVMVYSKHKLRNGVSKAASKSI